MQTTTEEGPASGESGGYKERIFIYRKKSGHNMMAAVIAPRPNTETATIQMIAIVYIVDASAIQ
jgi:hypothetical protein